MPTLTESSSNPGHARSCGPDTCELCRFLVLQGREPHGAKHDKSAWRASPHPSDGWKEGSSETRPEASEPWPRPSLAWLRTAGQPAPTLHKPGLGIAWHERTRLRKGRRNALAHTQPMAGVKPESETPPEASLQGTMAQYGMAVDGRSTGANATQARHGHSLASAHTPAQRSPQRGTPSR